ncbi:MAG TPA: 16S rRNA (guanine(527)-N(7))-methyltransferase RsmG [Candidatus Dormibacteraeota bacterium]|nr:16S rRNA (guanine(527)-N(7))-methyltransferase RsmG [Candidatus Dormibacteraeota bacterium]
MNDSKLAELARLIDAWPGLVSAPAQELVDDCLVLVPHLAEASTLVDVGSGGGLPGLPLKIMVPRLEVTLVEADGRKAAFLTQACASLGLAGVRVVGRRAEDAAHDPGLRESFDVAVARALAPMPVLAELCLPFVRVGGRLLAQKTRDEDIGSAARAIQLLGGAPARVEPAPSRARSAGVVVAVEKVAPTPATYPRRAGVPSRRPL